jgi:urease accessory protein
VRAYSRIGVELRDGRSVVRELRCEPPLVLRQTGPAQVHLVAGAGGPLGGDELTLELVVGPGARLALRSTAATVALPGAAGAGPSLLRVRASVGAGGFLELAPEPTVAAAGCDHRMDTDVRLAPGAGLLLREELVTGRTGERPGGRLVAGLRVRRGGTPLLAQDLALGPGRDGPATLAGATVVGTVLSVAADPVVADPVAWDPDCCELVGDQAVLSALAAPGAWLVCAVGPDAVDVRAALDEGLRRVAARRHAAPAPQ